MPEIFKWQPANLIDWQEDTTWRTLQTTMESGKIRTRKKWDYPKRSAQHLIVNFLELNEADEIQDFFNNHSGAYAAFYLPSWCRETRLNSDITINDTIINVEQSKFFVSSPNLHGYYLHLTSLSSLMLQQVIAVNTLISTFQIGLTACVSTAFQIKSWVQRAYLSRFVSDSFKKRKKGFHIYEVEFQFMEG